MTMVSVLPNGPLECASRSPVSLFPFLRKHVPPLPSCRGGLGELPPSHNWPEPKNGTVGSGTGSLLPVPANCGTARVRPDRRGKTEAVTQVLLTCHDSYDSYVLFAMFVLFFESFSTWR